MPADLSTRIRSIQKQIAVPQTGMVDLPTCQALELRLQIKAQGSTLIAHIKAVQQALKLDADGVVGPFTVSRIEALIAPLLPAIPTGASMVVSVKGLDLIITSEVASKEVYMQKYQSPIWAGGDSGVTIGIGYDCGYCTKKEFTDTWQPYLSQKTLLALSATVGKKGVGSKALIPALSNIKIPYDVAIKVFYATTLPACARDVKRAYPGVEKLPPDAQSAMLSLIYNRGPLINDTDRRKEMKALVPLIATGDLKGMAQQIRNMQRLWDPKTQKGLIIRREKEAALIEKATFDWLPENVVIV